jgi:hypothetical protein
MGMTFVFMILQGIYLARYAENSEAIINTPPHDRDKTH